MIYTIKAHPTMYKNVLFRSRLEARWAAFFDLIGWTWAYEPIDLIGWTPDFVVSWECGHSGCSGNERPYWHSLYIEVKPYETVAQFKGHAAMCKIEEYANQRC